VKGFSVKKEASSGLAKPKQHQKLLFSSCFLAFLVGGSSVERRRRGLFGTRQRPLVAPPQPETCDLIDNTPSAERSRTETLDRKARPVFTNSLNFQAKMASQTQGIQQLLAAEKRAAEKVSEARKSEDFSSNFLFLGTMEAVVLFHMLLTLRAIWLFTFS
jgi:Vacuolar (H+)-ATPase G subunit